MTNFMMTMSTIQHNINYQRIEQAIKYLEANFHRQPDLDEVAEKVHVSPFHFQRMFTEWAGISPKRFLQYLTVEFLKQKLSQTRNLTEAAESVGLSSQSRVYDLFTTLEAVTPEKYRLHGAGIRISYGVQPSPFGMALIGITERGICWLSFLAADQDNRSAVEEMKQHWFNSVFEEDNDMAAQFLAKIFEKQLQNRLHVLVKGTNFQVKVWEALLRIPMGDVATYEDIARKIDNPRALQAVGSAVGSNHIAFLIPCHRVIRKDGILGHYRWESSRKKGIIGWEMATIETANKH
jgi:AraC family transcriptional regulator, regulatory protein of adaptative response / methylated-DNA-[protein]-cysteine methyltransferase